MVEVIPSGFAFSIGTSPDLTIYSVDIQTNFPLSSDRIVKTEGVCGGDARIEGTRIPVWTLIRYKELGADVDQLLSMYPTIDPSDLIHAFYYYAENRCEIDRQIYENEIA